jgi:hypothetical protein
VGEAAASKVKLPKKRAHVDEEDCDSDESGGGAKKIEGRPKRGRKSAEQSGREIVQGLERPGAIGNGRLTVSISDTSVYIFNRD